MARLRRCPVIYRGPGDQSIVDLAHSGGATVLVSGDADLLSLAGQTAFDIESPAAYRQRVQGHWGRQGGPDMAITNQERASQARCCCLVI